jgi:hypothetical protein
MMKNPFQLFFSFIFDLFLYFIKLAKLFYLNLIAFFILFETLDLFLLGINF